MPREIYSSRLGVGGGGFPGRIEVGLSVEPLWFRRLCFVVSQKKETTTGQS